MSYNTQHLADFSTADELLGVDHPTDLLDRIRVETVPDGGTELDGAGIWGEDESTLSPDLQRGTIHWDLTEAVLENTPDVADLGASIQSALGAQLRADTAELAIRGDEQAETEDADADDFFQQNDGFLSLLRDAGVPTVVPEEVGVRGASSDVFIALVTRVQENSPTSNPFTDEWVFLVDDDTADLHQDAAQMVTPGSLPAINTTVDGTLYSFDILRASDLVPDFPQNTILFTHPENLVYVVRDHVDVDVDDRLDSEGVVKIEVTIYDDFLVDTPEAAALAQGFGP